MDASHLQAIPASQWTRSLSGVPHTEHAKVDEYFVGSGAIGAGKARDEGMRLWMDEYVRAMKFHRNETGYLVAARVRPSMRSSSPYWSSFYLKVDGSINAGVCDCKAGAGGVCKHVAAVWYKLWSLQKKHILEVPEDTSVTDVPAYWLSRSAPTTSGLPFRNIVIVKHRSIPFGVSDATAAALLNPGRTSRSELYQPFPRPQDRLVSSSDLRKLAAGLEEIGSGAMVVDAIAANEYRPHHDPAMLMELDYADLTSTGPPVVTKRAALPARVQLPSTQLSPCPSMNWDTFVDTLFLGESSPHITGLPAVELPPSSIVTHVKHLSPKEEMQLRRKGVCVSEDGAVRLERATRSQSNCQLWHSLRHVRLTASNFGAVCKRSRASFPKSILNTCLGKSVVETKVRLYFTDSKYGPGR